MPQSDERDSASVIRVVYDGTGSDAQECLRRLARALPGVDRDATTVTCPGTPIGGRAVLYRVAAVPDDPVERREMLSSCDAVVFVTRTDADALERARPAFASTRATLAGRADGPIGMVVQLHRPDAQGLAAEEAGAALEALDAVLVETDAEVLAPFIAATRLAADRHRARPRREPIALPVAEPTDPEPVDPHLHIRVEAAGPDLPLPDLERALEGHVWPPAGGRSLLASRLRRPLRWHASAAPWAGEGAREARSDDAEEPPFLLHTSDQWAFEDRAEARLELVAIAERLRALGRFTPPGRALSLHHDGQAHRIWMLTDRLPTLREQLEQSRSEGKGFSEAAMDRVRELVDALRDVRLTLPLEDAVGMGESGVYLLAIPAGRESGSPLGGLGRLQVYVSSIEATKLRRSRRA
ncbi:MAG: hypothetical protein R3B82_15110 [Sandaracinaceae bacterium]